MMERDGVASPALRGGFNIQSMTMQSNLIPSSLVPLQGMRTQTSILLYRYHIQVKRNIGWVIKLDRYVIRIVEDRISLHIGTDTLHLAVSLQKISRSSLL